MLVSFDTVFFMPSKNVIKKYKEFSFYHVYNRGIDKKDVFHDDQDYYYYRKLALEKYNRFGLIKIDIFSLIANHFHFLLLQGELDTMTNFMRSLMVSYVQYYNAKYDHIGPIFTPKYRARLIKSAHSYRLTYEYIEKNALNAGYPDWKHMGTKL